MQAPNPNPLGFVCLRACRPTTSSLLGKHHSTTICFAKRPRPSILDPESPKPGALRSECLKLKTPKAHKAKNLWPSAFNPANLWPHRIAASLTSSRPPTTIHRAETARRQPATEICCIDGNLQQCRGLLRHTSRQSPQFRLLGPPGHCDFQGSFL